MFAMPFTALYRRRRLCQPPSGRVLYLRGVAAVAREALQSEDERVVRLALGILEHEVKQLPETALKSAHGATIRRTGITGLGGI